VRRHVFVVFVLMLTSCTSGQREAKQAGSASSAAAAASPTLGAAKVAPALAPTKPAAPTSAAAGSNQAVLTYNPGSSLKLEQIFGDCDWTDVPYGAQGTCHQPVPSQTISKYNILGADEGYSFEDNGRLVFLFGDTIPAKGDFHARDSFAWSTSSDPGSGPLLNFYTNKDGSPLFVTPPGIKMGADDVPNSGITLNNQAYMIVNTGSDISQSDPHANDYSVLVRFDEATGSFSTGRTISKLPGGHFVFTALHSSGPDVLMFGIGDYHASDIYLATVPASSFESGAGTRYFAGLNNGQPVWSDTESGAVPVMQSSPFNGSGWPNDKPTVGKVSVAYSNDLGLWLMTYDVAKQPEDVNGVYFAYAPAPWGPWSKPQLIFNATRDHGYGVFMHNPGSNPPGPAGPMIGSTNNPQTDRGAIYAPFMIERFMRVAGSTLDIYYVISTWNPYTVVEMRSEFTISR
jgi:hypothetical protein